MPLPSACHWNGTKNWKRGEEPLSRALTFEFFFASNVRQSLERGKYLRPLISRHGRRLSSSRRASFLGFFQVNTWGSEYAAKGPCPRCMVYISPATFRRHHYLQSSTALTETFIIGSGPQVNGVLLRNTELFMYGHFYAIEPLKVLQDNGLLSLHCPAIAKKYIILLILILGDGNIITLL